MNYQKIYNSIIERAHVCEIHGYSERHHIIPKCMGGLNKNNIVSLTPEEHYIVHQLLVKIYPQNRQLLHAANMMGNRNNKKYGWIKRKFIASISGSNNYWHGKTFSKEHREKISLKNRGEKHPNYGKQMSETQKEKIRQKNIGRVFLEETKKKISLKLKNRQFTESHKRKIGDANKGKVRSPEYIKNLIKRQTELLSSPLNHPMYGKHHSEETKVKISLSQRGIPRHSEEQKKKWSLARVGKRTGLDNPMYGKPAWNRGITHSNSVKEKMSIIQKKLYESGYVNPFKYKLHSEETKQKMKLAWQKRKEKNNE